MYSCSFLITDLDKEVFSWLMENHAAGGWNYRHKFLVTVEFYDEDLALMFKLAWSHRILPKIKVPEIRNLNN